MNQSVAKEDRARLEKAIRDAESQTSGEIVVAVQQAIKGDPYEEARRFFVAQGLDKTRDRNGVLIYLGLTSQKVAVLGDIAIHEKVPPNFWDDIVSIMTARFTDQDVIGGLEAAVLALGKRLSTYFPPQANDVNELPDDLCTNP